MQILVWDPNSETLDDFNARLAHECLEEEDFFECQMQAVDRRLVVKLYSVYDAPQKLGVFNRILPIVYELSPDTKDVETQLLAWMKAVETVNDTMVTHDIQFAYLGQSTYVLFVLAEVTDEFADAVLGDESDDEADADGEEPEEEQPQRN